MFGQGIVTGPAIPLYMLTGAIVGWAVLSPLAKLQGWAPGDVGDWQSGSRGWILWPALSSLLAECLVDLFWMLSGLEPVWPNIHHTMPKAPSIHIG